MKLHAEELSALARQRIWIAGSGKSGIGAALLCRKFGLTPFLSDSGRLSDETKSLLASNGVGFEDGGHSPDRFDAECDLLVISPAILMSQGLAWRARQNGTPVISEIELASWFLPESTRICGITGTNGKSTTAHYLGQLLARLGFTGVACGNIGTAISAVAQEQSRCANLALALELSSYQLESTYSLKPNVGILLNLQNDHQERYRNLEEYLKAKWRLFSMIPEDGLAIVDMSALTLGVRLGLPLPRCETVVIRRRSDNLVPTVRETPLKRIWQGAAALPVARYGSLCELAPESLLAPSVLGTAEYSMINNGISVEIYLPKRAVRSTFRVNHPCLPGEHNVQNILAASVAALHLGGNFDEIVAQWELETSRYHHLAHRLEEIGRRGETFADSKGTRKKVRIFNDSKATNVESVLVALRSFSAPIRLLLGGQSKGESYSALARLNHGTLASVHPFGAAANEILAELQPILGNRVFPPEKTMCSAAQTALDHANDGDIVLLSPACASFDEFRNFEERGTNFCAWAKERLEAMNDR